MPSNPHDWQLLFTGVVVGMIISVVFGVAMFTYSIRSVAANIKARYSSDVESPGLDTKQLLQTSLYLCESEQIPIWMR